MVSIKYRLTISNPTINIPVPSVFQHEFQSASLYVYVFMLENCWNWNIDCRIIDSQPVYCCQLLQRCHFKCVHVNGHYVSAALSVSVVVHFKFKIFTISNNTTCPLGLTYDLVYIWKWSKVTNNKVLHSKVH